MSRFHFPQLVTVYIFLYHLSHVSSLLHFCVVRVIFSLQLFLSTSYHWPYVFCFSFLRLTLMSSSFTLFFTFWLTMLIRVCVFIFTVLFLLLSLSHLACSRVPLWFTHQYFLSLTQPINSNVQYIFVCHFFFHFLFLNLLVSQQYHYFSVIQNVLFFF